VSSPGEGSGEITPALWTGKLDAGMAFTTDSYVVKPLFFPGGDIGKLAVCGTVNGLAMCRARPLALSADFILKEGLPMETLQRVVRSMGNTGVSPISWTPKGWCEKGTG